jgi:ethanolamine utilization cobalamin adenosyltransferase
MSTEQIPDFQVVECFDSVINKCIAKERKITHKTGKLIELIWKIIEFVRNILEIEILR